LIWNYQHNWITISHVASNAKAGEPWSPAVFEFLGAEFGLFNPVFFVATVWAAIALWRRSRHNPILVYFFCMGAPLFLVYFFWSFHSRIFPNWIAPSVLPLFCLMVGYWDTQWRLGSWLGLKKAVIAGCAIGVPLVIIAHDTELIGKLTGHYLPIYLDPLHRARGWKDAAAMTSGVRRELLTEGKPVFIIAAHYRIAGELSFYLPDPEAQTRNPPLVYCRRGPVPGNQFYFWPGYTGRKGENALFIVEINRDDSKTKSPPAELCREFESVTDIGVREVLDHNRVLWRWQFFACRNLR